jgi:putative phage-type endonuclease
MDRINASQAGAILGYNPWRTRTDVMSDMVCRANGYYKSFVPTEVTLHGSNFEKKAILWAEVMLESLIQPCYGAKHAGHVGARFDGIVEKNGLPIEAKCPYSLYHNYAWGKDVSFLPVIEQPSYYTQVQLGMLCHDVQMCYFFQYVAPDVCLLEEVHRCDDWLEGAINELNAFYAEYLEELKNPEPWIREALGYDEPRNPYTMQHD